MSTALERILEIEARGNRASADFYMDQTRRAGDLLWDVIKALDVKPIRTVNDEIDPDDALLFGMYRASDILAAAQELKASAAFSAAKLETVSE